MNIIFICLFSILVLPQLPWWAVAITASMAGLLSRGYFSSVINGFFCGSIPWAVAFMYKYYTGADILITRVSMMLGFDHWIGSLVVTILIGGVSAIMGSLCAYSFKRAFRDQLTQA